MLFTLVKKTVRVEQGSRAASFTQKLSDQYLLSIRFLLFLFEHGCSSFSMIENYCCVNGKQF